jgi:7,8-dihydropterin-6-yl-methyl-4-(beta-D-ribofuranosyl)aminobenzene 5'-phosphate synthase
MADKMKITVIYDNNAEEGLTSGWGFSCLVEDEEKILFDCGDNGRALLNNMRKLGIDPASIDIIVLSHDHWDHTGGLAELLRHTGNVKVFVPASFSDETKAIMKGRADIVEARGMQQVSGNAYTTGELGSGFGTPKEQSLVLKTGKGLVVIAGCSHPGVGSIIAKAREMGKVYWILGGFHGFSDFGILKGISVVSPCHCTQHTSEIRENYPDNFREIKAGSVIVL